MNFIGPCLLVENMFSQKIDCHQGSENRQDGVNVPAGRRLIDGKSVGHRRQLFRIVELFHEAPDAGGGGI
jgi:hypothetical protein